MSRTLHKTPPGRGPSRAQSPTPENPDGHGRYVGAETQVQAATVSTRPTVVNLREVDLRDEDVVRIDRRSDWGNPYRIGPDGDRAQVIEAYRRWIGARADLLARLEELAGKRLACWCAPRACHGDVLAELVGQRLDLPAPDGPGRPCPRCNSRFGTTEGEDLCANCRRDLLRAGVEVPAAPAARVEEPVDPCAEGWAWMLAPCQRCGRQTVYADEVCSYCRGRANLAKPRCGVTPPGPRAHTGTA